MRRGKLPDDIRRFILTSVPSVPCLEAILLLRNDPDVGWDVQRLAARLYVAERQAVMAARSRCSPRALGTAGEELWRRSKPVRVLALVEWRKEDADPSYHNRLTCERWLVPVVELIHR
ncbi:MAG TPA: hypothetical protein VF756_29825 [Thermoanaerobaculia bacterium]